MNPFLVSSTWALSDNNLTYVEGVAAISDRIELQHWAWLLDENGEIADLLWGSLPDPIYIGVVVEPNKDGTPVFTTTEVFKQLKAKTNTPAKEAV